MVPALCQSTAAVLPPADQRALAKQPVSVQCTALVVVTLCWPLALSVGWMAPHDRQAHLTHGTSMIRNGD